MIALDTETVDTALKAIAEPQRRKILQLVRTRELSAGRIASHFRGISREAVSQHLRLLKQAGLVSTRREGTWCFYRARPEGLTGVQKFLDSFWGVRLERLREVAERRERRKRHGD